MSPSCSLVALACACAMLPLAASMNNVAGPDNALPAPYDGYCNTQLKGYRSRNPLDLPAILIPATQKNYQLEIPDKCSEQHMELVGGMVTACDADVAPKLRLPSMMAGNGLLNRLGALKTNAHCYIKQYCI